MNLSKKNKFIENNYSTISLLNEGDITEDSHKLMKEKEILYFIREKSEGMEEMNLSAV